MRLLVDSNVRFVTADTDFVQFPFLEAANPFH